MDSPIVNTVLISVGCVSLIAAVIAATINRTTVWKASLVIAVLLICLGSLIPPSQTLNLGIDLRGGTSLLYEVDIPGDVNAEDTMQRVIEVIRRRIDPNGVRNLLFTVESGNRIQIQMPHASPDVLKLRQDLTDLEEQIEAANVSRSSLYNALRAPASDRAARFDDLIKGVEQRRPLLEAAAAQYDALQAAEAELAAASDPTDAQRTQLIAKVGDAQIALERAVEEFEATNVDLTRLRQIMELSTARKIEDGVEVPGSSPREQALASLRQRHPQRAAQIDQYVAAYDAYYSKKRPLEDPEDLIRLLRGQGVLEFHITVNPSADQVAPNEIDQLREQLRTRGLAGQRADAPMKWYVVDDANQWLDDAVRAVRLDQPLTPSGEIREELSRQLRERPDEFFSQHFGLIGAGDGVRYYLLLWDTADKSMTQRQPGWQLTSASPTIDDKGLPAVAFRLNTFGGKYLGALTKANTGRQMAIVLDGRVYSAPGIRTEIRDSGVIEGRFNQAELDYLINTLAAGSLKARLSEDPIEVRTIQPFIGADNLIKGFDAAVDALIAVAVFMMLYYFFAGFVADLALLANLVVILGIMAALQATFTLPGIAGIVLTIGMCVDANVLIFERIREELNAGADMPTALRLGYQKAFSSIIDGNLTNLIVCFILGYTATADVKGFAVTLGVGICATLFTSLFMTRVIFTIYYAIFGGARQMNMLPSAVKAVERILSPTIRWIDKRVIFFTFSGVLLIGSLFMCYTRGEEIFDIEFRGGTEVSFDLKEDQRLVLDEARQRLGDKLADYYVVPVGQTDAQFRAGAFSVVTIEPDKDKVAQIVRDAFEDVIDVPPVIDFAGMESDLGAAPVYPITDSNLGSVIGRPQALEEVGDYLGGVAIVLDNISPSDSIADLADRIKRMRFQPDYEDLKFRNFQVIGLREDPAAPDHFTSAVVVSRDPDISYFEDAGTWEAQLAATEWNLVRDALQRQTSLSKVSNFTPTVARTIRDNAIVALTLSIFAIVAYIWIRFGSLRYGLAAIAALIHDVLITLGLVAASGYIYAAIGDNFLLIQPFKINMGMIAALLTIIGYSLNDTIVLFDRIRENRGKLAVATPGIINDSINQVISRTVLTSFTTFLAVGMMYVFGGDGIHGFAFALVVGVVVGTYSSVAIASPLLLVGTKYASRSEGS